MFVLVDMASHPCACKYFTKIVIVNKSDNNLIQREISNNTLNTGGQMALFYCVQFGQCRQITLMMTTTSKTVKNMP